MVNRILLARNSKSPPEGPWHITSDTDEVAAWTGNVGTMMKENNLVVVDIDSGKERARKFWKCHRAMCQTVVETRRGIHIYFQGQTETRKFDDGDVKGSGYVVSPQSIVDGWPYRWIAQGEPPAWADYEHLFQPKQERREVVRKQVKNVRAYLAKVVSIEGQHGSHGLVRAASICRDAGMSESQATLALLEWNSGPTVSPPWPHEEIARAITRVFQKGKQ